jgi:hypothetical protein
LVARTEEPPGAFRVLLGAVDPLDGGREMKLARDLLAPHSYLNAASLAEVKTYVDELLADRDIANADLKGLLNRNAGPAWGAQFDFGADAKAARRYLEALSRAIAQEVS